MARRDENILTLLVQCPWWVSVTLAGSAYVVFSFVIPWLIPATASPAMRGLLGAAPLVAPLLALVLLVPALPLRPFAHGASAGYSMRSRI